MAPAPAPHARTAARLGTGCILALALLVPGGAASGEMPESERLAIHAYVQAALMGDAAAVHTALDAGMPVDATLPPRDPRYPYTQRTALEAAAVHARVELVELLLERGASLRRNERYGLYAAAMHEGDSPELLAALARHRGLGADLDADFGPALVRAAANGALGEVDYLLDLGVDPNYRNRHEPWDSPAIVRAQYHFEVTDRLLAAGADPTGGDLPFRWSPLFPAASAGEAERVRRLLELGVDPHVHGERGNALSLAACSAPRTSRPGAEQKTRANEVVGVLLAAGVDPNVHSDSRTPLRCAEDAGNTELAAALEAAGGRSHESLWYRAKRAVGVAVMSLAILFGGGM